MGDDIGWSNIGVYKQGIMAGRTPNLDRLAAQGMRFTDYHAEASCTAGRANFITGELPFRTGLTRVGQAGSPLGTPDEAGRRPWMDHVARADRVFERLRITDDPTEQPRWGKIGKQRIEDAGELCPKRMETVDDEILDDALKFMDQAKRDNKPFFLWLNATRMHVVTHLSEKYEKMRTSENGWSVQEAHGASRRHRRLGDEAPRRHGRHGRHHTRLLDRQRRRELHLARWRPNPIRGRQGNGSRRRFPSSLHHPLARQSAGRQGRERHFSVLDWFPTFVAAAGDPNVVDELLKGKHIGDWTYKVHLDGYDQTDVITGKGPSKLHEIFYFTETTVAAIRINDFKFRFTDQPGGWLGGTIKVDWPILTNLRLDPYERTGIPDGKEGSFGYYNWFIYEFWRFVFVQQEVEKAAQTMIDYPPMQKGASFNLEAVKAQIVKAMHSHSGD
jgi:arylsulfatase